MFYGQKMYGFRKTEESRCKGTQITWKIQMTKLDIAW